MVYKSLFVLLRNVESVVETFCGFSGVHRASAAHRSLAKTLANFISQSIITLPRAT